MVTFAGCWVLVLVCGFVGWVDGVGLSCCVDLVGCVCFCLCLWIMFGVGFSLFCVWLGWVLI